MWHRNGCNKNWKQLWNTHNNCFKVMKMIILSVYRKWIINKYQHQRKILLSINKYEIFLNNTIGKNLFYFTHFWILVSNNPFLFIKIKLKYLAVKNWKTVISVQLSEYFRYRTIEFCGLSKFIAKYLKGNNKNKNNATIYWHQVIRRDERYFWLLKEFTYK